MNILNNPVLLICIAVGGVILFLTFGNEGKKDRLDKEKKEFVGIITGKKLMTEHEKKMFRLLREAVPELYIFSQVCLGGILHANVPLRYRFAQKMADYVITDIDFNILVVIELDDSSHKGKEQKDAERDAMVRQGGHRTLRYPSIPSIEVLREDIMRG